MKILLKIAGVLILFGILTTCTVDPAGRGSLILNFSMRQGRTLLPDLDMQPASYVITGAGPGSNAFTITSSQAQVTQAGLAFGAWTVFADALNAGGMIIGHGEGTIIVHTNETSSLDITITPLAGSGTLALTVNWNAADTDYPTIQAQLIPRTGSPVDLGFTITGGSTGTCTHPAIPAGYYSLTVMLMDGNLAHTTPLLTMGAVEVVRIVQDQVTSGSFDFTRINKKTGAIQVNITPEMADPLPVTLSGQQATMYENGSMTVTASVPPEAGNVTYVWYINGVSMATGASYTVSGSALGVYRLDAVVYTVDGLKAGSATHLFDVVEAPPAKIVFVSNRDGNNDIYTMNSDGSSVTRLTSRNSPSIGSPAYSPDGTLIVFEDVGCDTDVYLMNADGTNQRVVPGLSCNIDSDAFFSPDGTKLVMYWSACCWQGEVVIQNLDGSDRRNISNNPAFDGSASFAPDGRVVFTSSRTGTGQIFIMNADGTNQINLSNNLFNDGNPSFCADGTKIVFCSNQEGNYEVYSMDASGLNQTRLTNNPADDIVSSGGAILADCSKIVFYSNRDGNNEIYIMNIDGSGQTRLTDNPANDNAPAFSPLQ